MIDEVLLSFLHNNPFTVGLVIGTLKIIANETDWVLDNKIISLLSLKGRKKFKEEQ